MADPRPGELTPKLSEMLVAEIKRQGITGKSSRQISREFGVHYQTVANYRRRLEKAGVIERLPRGSTALRIDNPAAGSAAYDAEARPAGTFSAADFWAKMPDLEILTGPQILKRLSYLSVSPDVPPTVHVSAAKALYELREAEASREKVDLSAPQTPEAAFADLKLMRACVGSDTWLRVHEAVSQEEDSLWKSSRSSSSSSPKTPESETSAPESPPRGSTSRPLEPTESATPAARVAAADGESSRIPTPGSAGPAPRDSLLAGTEDERGAEGPRGPAPGE